MGLTGREALIERLRDAFEDQGMYAPAPEIVEGVYEDAVEPLRRQLAGAVDLLREIGAMAGAKANGADARAMAKRAREFVASLDHLGGQ
jgi:hypothetical protein